MLNDSLIAIVPCMDLPGGKSDTTVYIGRNAAGNNFKGHIDEMRVWNIARDPAHLARDQPRLMAGNETGLAAYWRFDETILDEFYDISNVNSMCNRDDGGISYTARPRSALTGPATL